MFSGFYSYLGGYDRVCIRVVEGEKFMVFREDLFIKYELVQVLYFEDRYLCQRQKFFFLLFQYLSSEFLVVESLGNSILEYCIMEDLV